jgi:FkbH-like protein
MTGSATATPADARAAIEAALDAGVTGVARGLADAYWRANPNASAARFLVARLERLWPADRIVDHRVAVLRSFTVEPVVPLLQAEAALGGCRVHPWVGDFNTYGQEILDSQSGLYGHRPDTVVLAVQARDLAPELWSGFATPDDAAIAAGIEAATERLAGLVDQLRARTDANILVHGLAAPPLSSEGLVETLREHTQAEAIAAVNVALRRRFRDMSGVVLLDVQGLQARFGAQAFNSEKKWATAKLPLSVDALGWLAQEWWRYLCVLAMPPAKVLALDLDNTLWGGVVGEDGLRGIKLGEEFPGVFFKDFQRAILDVARRGVLVALVSKNNLEDAMRVFDEHPDMVLRREHIAAMRVNWEPKVTNLIAIAKELNLGLESIVFFDDNPVERAAIRRGLPDVIVPELDDDPSTFVQALRSIPSLERLQRSSEDAARTRLYAEERERRVLQESAEDVESFLASLDIRVEVSAIDDLSLARAAQLTQKTNQLNMTTRRYKEAELSARLSSGELRGYVLRSTDRFGDNGTVGVALMSLADGVAELDTFLMSCRVIGRQIETAFLAVLADEARAAGASRLSGWFRPTAKNAPARDIYRQAGLSLDRSAENADLWGLDLAQDAIAVPSWIQLTEARARPEGPAHT